MHRRFVLVLAVAALTLCAIVPSVSGVVTDTTPFEIGILVGLNSTDSEMYSLQMSGYQGLLSAFWRINREGGVRGTHPIVTRVAMTDYDYTKYPAWTLGLVRTYPNILAFAGTIGDIQLMAAGQVLSMYNIPQLGPISGSAGVRKTFDPMKVFIRADPYAEVLSIVKLSVNRFHFQRIGYMWTSHCDFGDEQYADSLAVMSSLGLSFCAILEHDWSKYTYDLGTFTNTYAATLATKFLMTRPQALVGMSRTATESAVILGTILMHPLVDPNLVVFIASPMAELARAVYYTYRFNISLTNHPVYFVMTGPSPADTTYQIVQNYQRDIVQMLGYTEAVKWMNYVGIGGYAIGIFTAKVMERVYNFTKQEVYDAIYNSGVFQVDDLVFGVFNGACSGKRSGKSECYCNQGGKIIETAILSRSFTWDPIANGTFQFSLAECTPRSEVVPSPIVFVRAFPNTTIGVATQALLTLGHQAAEATTTTSFSVSEFTVTPATGNTSVATAVALVAANYITTAGLQDVAYDSATLHPTVPIIDPFFINVSLAPAFRRNIIYLSPTLQQELFSVAHVVALEAANAFILRRAWLSPSITTLYEQSLNTYGKVLSGSAVFENSLTTALSAFPVEANILVVGVSVSEAGELLDFLVSRPRTIISMAFNELSLLYSTFLASPLTSAVGNRIRFATSMPNWGANDTTPLMLAYRTKFPQGHPLTLRGFIASRAAILIRSHITGVVNSTTFLDALYQTGVLTVDSMVVLGPYSDSNCSAGLTNCECNIGSREIRVLNLSATTAQNAAISSRPTEPLLLQSMSSATIEYKPLPKESKLSAGVIAAIVIAGVVVIAACVGFAATRKSNARDVSCAPKDATKPYTLIFTDIQQSTTLWSLAPEQMGPGLDSHHALIRKCIAKHRAYEVKTVGDCFMIACSSAEQAVDVAYDIQTSLFKHDWGTTVFDETYKESEREQLEEQTNLDRCLLSCTLSDDVYKTMWNGIRVRIGVHTGIGDIKFDEITKGYDYYGSVPNIASRTESCAHGGQVLCTGPVMEALGPAAAKYTFKQLDPQLLRGVTDPVPMHQLQAVPGRTFRPLRTEAPEADEKAGTQDLEGSQSMSSDQQQPGQLKTPQQDESSREMRLMVAAVVNNLFASSDAKYRHTTLKELCKKWRLPHNHGAWKEADETSAVEQISARLAVIMNRKKMRLMPHASNVSRRSSLYKDNKDAVQTLQPEKSSEALKPITSGGGSSSASFTPKKEDTKESSLKETPLPGIPEFTVTPSE